MPTIHLEDDKTYGDVLYQLYYKIGGSFQSWEGRRLVVSDWQLKLLQESGILAENGQPKRKQGGKKKKK